MYINMSNMFMTDEIEKLPKEAFKFGNHIVLLESKDCSRRSSGEQVNTMNMCLVNKISDIFYGFNCNHTRVKVYTEEDFSYDKEKLHDDEFIDSELDVETQITRAYIRIKDELMLVRESGRREDDVYGFDSVEEDHHHQEWFNVYEFIHKTIFNENYINGFVKKCYLDGKFYSFIAFELDENNKLVFNIEQRIEDSTYSWSLSKNIILFTKNSKHAINLYFDNFEKTYEKIKSMYSSIFYDFKDFEQTMFVANYDINKHLTLTESEKILNLNKIEKEFGLIFYKERVSLNRFFSPVYEDRENDMQVYVANPSSYHKKMKVIIKGKEHYGFEYGRSEDVSDLISDASAVFQYEVINKQQGFNPFDGKFYKDGELYHSKMSYGYFLCDFGAITTQVEYKQEEEKFYLKTNKVYKEFKLNEENFEKLLPLRIAEAEYEFESNNKTGVNPKDGCYYINGEKTSIDYEQYYGDFDGAMVRVNSIASNFLDGYEFYLKFGDYYLKAKKSRPQEMTRMRELKDRHKTVMILTKEN